jgi:hypothetical protein
MKAIIRIQEKRAADSQQPKNTAFRVRKRPVNQGKIDRYKKEHPLQSPGADPDVMDGNMSPAGMIPATFRASFDNSLTYI